MCHCPHLGKPPANYRYTTYILNLLQLENARNHSEAVEKVKSRKIWSCKINKSEDRKIKI
jgi:hypothetical protein